MQMVAKRKATDAEELKDREGLIPSSTSTPGSFLSLTELADFSTKYISTNVIGPKSLEVA